MGTAAGGTLAVARILDGCIMDLVPSERKQKITHLNKLRKSRTNDMVTINIQDVYTHVSTAEYIAASVLKVEIYKIILALLYSILNYCIVSAQQDYYVELRYYTNLTFYLFSHGFLFSQIFVMNIFSVI